MTFAPKALALLLLLTLAGPLPACTDPGSADPAQGDSSDDAAGVSADLTEDQGAPGDDATPPPPADLRGLWASTTVFRGISLHPLLGPQDESTTILALVELRDREGGGLETVTTTCLMDMHTEGSPVQSAVPAEFLLTLGPATRPLVLDDQGRSLAQGPYAEVFALTLDEPLSDPFPDSPEDPRIFDHDGDSKPGLTVRLTGLMDGEVFVAQRRLISWEASWDGQGFQGEAQQTLEELVLGAAPEVLLNYLPQHLPPEPPTVSTVTWRPLPPTATCADLGLPPRR